MPKVKYISERPTKYRYTFYLRYSLNSFPDDKTHPQYEAKFLRLFKKMTGKKVEYWMTESYNYRNRRSFIIRDVEITESKKEKIVKKLLEIDDGILRTVETDYRM